MNGEGNGNPLQYSCLENSTDRGAWQATVHGVTRVRHHLATMKRCSASSNIREMQIKITTRYHYTPSRRAKSRHTEHTKCWQGCAAPRALTLPEERKAVQPL